MKFSGLVTCGVARSSSDNSALLDLWMTCFHNNGAIEPESKTTCICFFEFARSRHQSNVKWRYV